MKLEMKNDNVITIWTIVCFCVAAFKYLSMEDVIDRTDFHFWFLIFILLLCTNLIIKAISRDKSKQQ